VIGSVNPLYRQVLAGAHEPYVRAEVWQSGIQVEELTLADPTVHTQTGAPVFLGGSVRATLTSRVARTLTLNVPDWLYPWNADDLLNPYGQIIKAYRGVRYGSGVVDEFPVFVGPIQNVKPQAGGVAVVSASDLASDVVGYSFSAPEVAPVGDTIPEEVRRLIRGAIPDATFGTFDAITAKVPALSYDVDRGAALDGLGKVVGAYWYPLANGSFVLRFIPWTQPLTSAGVPMTNVPGGLVNGLPAAATLISAFPVRDRAAVYSRITVSNEPTDGSAPFYATVDDEDLTSPTYVRGPYGVKAAQVRITQAATSGTCTEAARALLGRSKALTEAWSLTCVADGSIELGDVLPLLFRDRSGVDHQTIQLAASFSLPLDLHSPMTIDGRAPVGGDPTS
jgi:hypothetical protein